MVKSLDYHIQLSITAMFHAFHVLTKLKIPNSATLLLFQPRD